ncbi:MAG: hypothetical protein Q8K99_00540 [Actinomycetota bacterium]|nr:hypothetical protein [Actinomycetota bacterium]
MFADPTTPSPVVIEDATVAGSRIEAVVRVTDSRYLRTTAFPGIAERSLELLPGILRHRCECGSAHGIAAELADTETAHLLEHVALELMALGGSPRTLRGETRWDFRADGRGVFRVTLEYDDEHRVRDAFDRAAELVNELLSAGR